MSLPTEKACGKCGETKLLDDFFRDGSRKDGRQVYCRSCAAEYRRENREALSAYDRIVHLRRYDLTQECYEALLEAQGGTCAMPACDRSEPGGRWSTFHIDHDHDHNYAHAEGQIACRECIRGLLCMPCNSHRVGGYERSMADLALHEYLSDPPARRLLPARAAS